MSAPIAAALGGTDRLAELLPTASAEEIHRAFGLAVINGQVDAVQDWHHSQSGVHGNRGQGRRGDHRPLPVRLRRCISHSR